MNGFIWNLLDELHDIMVRMEEKDLYEQINDAMSLIESGAASDVDFEVEPDSCPYCDGGLKLRWKIKTGKRPDLEETTESDDANGQVYRIKCVGCTRSWREFWKGQDANGNNLFLSWQPIWED